MKVVNLEASKSSNIKLSKKDASSKTVELCSDLDSGSDTTETISFKCKNYESNESISCKLIYQFSNTKAKKAIKISDIDLKFGTWSYVMSSSNSFSNETELTQFIDNNCESSVKKVIKLPQNRSFAEALDTLVKVWRVEIVDSSEKKAIYYGKLLLDKHIAIWIKVE